MAPRKLSVGRNYSQSELNKLGIYSTGLEICNIKEIRFPLETVLIDKNCLENQRDDACFLGGSEYFPGMGSSLRLKPEDSLSIYSNGNRIFFIDEGRKSYTVHFYYKCLSSVILDACVYPSFFYEMAKRGVVEFSMKPDLKDPALLEESLKMNLLGILTYDKIFGLDNRLKERKRRRDKKISEEELRALSNEYKKLLPLLRENAIFFADNETPHNVFRKIHERQRRKKSRIKNGHEYYNELESYFSAI